MSSLETLLCFPTAWAPPTVEWSVGYRQEGADPSSERHVDTAGGLYRP